MPQRFCLIEVVGLVAHSECPVGAQRVSFAVAEIMKSIDLVFQVDEAGRRSRKTSSHWTRLLAAFGALSVVVLGYLVQTIPRPVDSNGVPVVSVGALLAVHGSFFVHMLGLTPMTAAPHIEEAVLKAAPAEWTLEPLPELIAGKDFKTRAEFVEAFRPFSNSKPVVVRQFLSHPDSAEWTGKWQAMKEPWWTVDHLKGQVGEAEVRVFLNYTDDNSIQWMKFKDYADIISADPESPAYARAINEHWEARPEMHHVADNTELLHELAGRHPANKAWLDAMDNAIGHNIMFVSSRKPNTQFHADASESFIVHTEGTKHWRLFGPENSMLFRPKGMINNVGVMMGFDGWNVDFEAHPQARLARGWEANISVGDMLYFPGQTWHGVQNIGALNVMADTAFMDVARSWVRNWPATLALLLHPKPPVELFKYCFLRWPSNDGHRLPERFACVKEVYFQAFKPAKKGA
eukprot:TRINITY_DN9748_c0_g1_i1.p1 TRINITY_DN9748_c0_g1~~TRINITY_DN9748_c0_g1_i1.p1  ORF type:complete len:461 (+),score=76.52 TRINITY_DN9748_c0_g1_i1:2-1384(+)